MLDVKEIYFIEYERYLHEFFTGIEFFYFKSPSDLSTASQNRFRYKWVTLYTGFQWHLFILGKLSIDNQDSGRIEGAAGWWWRAT